MGHRRRSSLSHTVFTLPVASGFGYSPRLVIRRRSSVVERILGKAEVQGSSPCGGTITTRRFGGAFFCAKPPIITRIILTQPNTSDRPLPQTRGHILRTETFSAFSNHRRIAAGDLRAVALDVARASKSGSEQVIVLSDLTGRPMDLDLRGSDAEISARYQSTDASVPVKPGRGRPKLGVVPREVTLLAGKPMMLSRTN